MSRTTSIRDGLGYDEVFRTFDPTIRVARGEFERMADAKRRLAAILSADVAGYSRLIGDDERATMETLNTSRAIFRRHISDYGGRVVDMAGDSVRALFGSIVEAVQCAVDVQSGRSEEALPELELAVRLSPHDPYLYVFQAIQAGAHNALGQFQQGEACARRATRHPRAGFWAYAHLAQALAGQENSEQARAALNTLLEMRPDFSPEFFERVWPNCDPTYLRMYFGLFRDAGLDIPNESATGGRPRS